MIMSKVNFDTFLQWVLYITILPFGVCGGFFFKSEVISQNRWWNVHLQKWCSRLFDKNITMPDWLQYILSSSILTVLIWTFFIFPSCFVRKLTSITDIVCWTSNQCRIPGSLLFIGTVVLIVYELAKQLFTGKIKSAYYSTTISMCFIKVVWVVRFDNKGYHPSNELNL